MKAIPFLLILILAFSSARLVAAGDPIQRSCMFKNTVASNDSLDHVQFLKAAARWKRMKTTGAVLTSVGGGMLLTGATLNWISFIKDVNTDSGQDKLWITGTVIDIVATAIIIPGIVMLVKGSKRYHRMKSVDKDHSFNGVTL